MSFRALLIGNWDYHDPTETLDALRGPENDLECLSRALCNEQFGLFNASDVIVEKNLTSVNIGVVINNFVKSAKRDDRLLLYYTGHGEVLADQQLGLCGVDIDYATKEAFCFDTTQLPGWIEKLSSAASVVVVLDCCYAGQLAFKGKGAVVTDEALDRSFGKGIAALCSSGSEQSLDAKKGEDPSPFTQELARVLIDPDLPGSDGYLNFELVFDALAGLKPPPKRKLSAQGVIPLAKRPRPSSELSAEGDPLGWRDTAPTTVEVSFQAGRVRVDFGTGFDPLERPLDSFDAHRQTAIRRLAQLSDAVARAGTESGTSTNSELVRRAWECIGSNLFESALPVGAYERMKTMQAGKKLVKLRLRFDPDDALEDYFWEYLCPTLPDQHGDASADANRPLGLRQELLIERVPSSAFQPLPQVASRSIVVFNSLPGDYGVATAALVDHVAQSLPHLTLVGGDLKGDRSTWAAFLATLINSPRFLVLGVPLRRVSRGHVDVGFRKGSGYEWRSIDEVLDELREAVPQLDAIIIETFAVEPGCDSYRGAVEAARAVADRGLGPVIFVCHSNGFEQHLMEVETRSFVFLLLDALSRGKPLDLCVYWARNQALRLGDATMRRTFGVPGYYGYRDDTTKARSSDTRRPPTATPTQVPA
ncbi:MAG: caspase family protein [Ilumatobacteraceae bacterium]